jgi:hypothetical protein
MIGKRIREFLGYKQVFYLVLSLTTAMANEFTLATRCMPFIVVVALTNDQRRHDLTARRLSYRSMLPVRKVRERGF